MKISRFYKELLKSSLVILKANSWIPFTALGIFLIIISGTIWFEGEDLEFISKGLFAAGSSILTSVVFFTIVKSKQFSDIFKKHLRDIIYCSEHLEKRKDIRDLWIKASKAMYEKNFPELKDIEDNIEEYLPMDSSKYYDNYIYKVDISFDSANEDFLVLNERESFTLVSRTKEDVEYKSSTIFQKKDSDDNISDYEMISFKINKQEIKPKKPELDINKKYKADEILVIHNRVLSGEHKYHIEKIEKKKYSLEVENTKSHSCSHIFKNYTLEITHPKDLEVEFYENGTLNSFKHMPIRKVGASLVKSFEYQGLMFKNQGTRLIFRDLRK